MTDPQIAAMRHYYNDIDPYCCKVLHKNITLGNLPEGDVDERDIRDIHATDLVGYQHISLFAGIGGIPLGLMRSGLYNIPGLRTLDGGFPCQDISQANQIDAQGLDSERSGLWKEYHRLICELRPHYIIVENVSALLVRGIERVLGDLASIGYDAQWQVLRACDFGLPHQRKRVFIVAYPASQRWLRIFTGTPSLRQSDIVYQRKQRRTQVSKVVALRHVLSQTESMLSQPSVCGMDDGLPNGVDEELKSLGNAVVPQCAEYVGRCIMAALTAESQVGT